MYRLGGATVDLEDVEDRRSVPVGGLTRDAVDLVVAEARSAGLSVTLDLVPDPGQPTFSGTIVTTGRRKRVVVESIAPEDIRFSPAARDEDKASYLGFIKRVTASDLVKLGLAQAEIADLASGRETTPEEAQRNDGALVEAGRSDEDDSEQIGRAHV